MQSIRPSWNDLFAELSVDNMRACFYSRFKVLLDKYIPVSSTASSNTSTPWLTKLVSKKSNKREKLRLNTDQPIFKEITWNMPSVEMIQLKLYVKQNILMCKI